MTRWLLCLTLATAGCGRASADADVAPDPAVAVDAPPAATATPPPTAEDAPAPTQVGDEPPLVAEPAPMAWTADLVPEPVREDAGARAFLATVAADGLAAHVDPEVGVVWDAEGTPTRVAVGELGEVDGGLSAALRAGAASARCRAGMCVVVGGGRWFIAVRRTGEAPGRVVAGVLRAADGWPDAARYVAWQAETAVAASSTAPSLIGDALSSEEAGHHERAYVKLGKAYAQSPDNPWPLYYMARVNAALGRYREAYVDFRRLSEHPSPFAVGIQLRVDSDDELARFRTHSAVRAVQAELALPAPDAPEAFVAWLRRFRGVEPRIATVLAAGGPTAREVMALLEAHLLDAGPADDSGVRWTDAGLSFARNPLGGLEVTGIVGRVGPGSAPPE